MIRAGLRADRHAYLPLSPRGGAEDALLRDFPDLAREDIRAVLAFAAARERRLVNSMA